MKSLIMITTVFLSCSFAFAKGKEDNPVHVEVINTPTVEVANFPVATVTPYTRDASTSSLSGDCNIISARVTCYFDVPDGDQVLKVEKITGLTDLGNVLVVRFSGEKVGGNSVVSVLLPKTVFVGFTNHFEASGPVYGYDSNEFIDSDGNQRDILLLIDADFLRVPSFASVTIVGQLLESAN